MRKVSIKSWDKHFSDCIRIRARWTCERCNKYYPEGRRMGLHCSHFHSRKAWSVRFDPENCEALCFHCHQHLGGNPHEHRERIMEKLGPYRYNALLERLQDISLGKTLHKERKLVSKHYLAEKRRMESEGCVDLVGY